MRIETESAQTQDSAKRLAAGELAIGNSIFGSFGAGTGNTQLFLAPNATSGGPTPATNYTVEHITATAQSNRVNLDPMLTGISRSRNKALDPRPATGSPALSGAKTPPADGFFTETNYVGAFKSSNWAKGWSAISALGYLTDGDTTVVEEPVVRGSTTKLFNISTRATLAANGTLFGGFTLSGTQSKTVIIRAVGPGLTPLGVSGALADPTMELFQGTNVIASNDDWSGTQASSLTAEAGGFSLPASSKDSVLVKTLAPGGYTVQIKGKGASGEVIFEVYEVR